MLQIDFTTVQTCKSSFSAAFPAVAARVNGRVEKAYTIALGNRIHSSFPGRYLVRSSNGELDYTVNTIQKSCNCPDQVSPCKHRIAVYFYQLLHVDPVETSQPIPEDLLTEYAAITMHASANLSPCPRPNFTPSDLASDKWVYGFVKYLHPWEGTLTVFVIAGPVYFNPTLRDNYRKVWAVFHQPFDDTDHTHLPASSFSPIEKVNGYYSKKYLSFLRP